MGQSTPKRSRRTEPTGRCSVCGKELSVAELLPLVMVRGPVAERIRAEHPQLAEDGLICRDDLLRYRTRTIETMLEADRGELTALERSVLESLERHEVLTRNIDSQFDEQRTLGERVADRVADFGGSWVFIGLFFLVLAGWIAGNSLLFLRHPFDPYPFILLNLVLSCLAAIQAPIIMMSQNRQEAKDRLRAQYDYRVNLKAELEIRLLHSKLDQLLSHQWQHLVEIQQMQMEMLEEIARSKPEGSAQPGR